MPPVTLLQLILYIQNLTMTIIQSIGRWLQSPPTPKVVPPPLRIGIYALIIVLALGLRIHLATIAHPAQMDSTHMIHQGILWVQGEPGALSTIWQEAPVLTAGMAYRLGYNPAETLQWSTVLYGTILVGMTMLLTRRLFDSDAAAWISGGWAACNPALLNYSVNSMPGIGFAACLISAYALMAPSIRGKSLKLISLLAGYALLGLGMYFKPLDSLTAMALTTGWLAIVFLAQIKKTSLYLLAGLLGFFIVVMPHYALQRAAPAGSGGGLVNRSHGLVYGHRAYNSMNNYNPDGFYAEERAEFQELGIAKWLWRHQAEVRQRYISNILQSLRIYGNMLFPNAFRIGNAWFMAAAITILLTGMMGARWKTYVFLALATMAFPFGVSLSFIFDRWLVIYVPLLMVATSGYLVSSPFLWSSKWKQIAWIFLVAIMAVISARSTHASLQDKVWKIDNQRTISEWLKQTSLPDERIMCVAPALLLDVDLHRPRRWVQLKAGTPERIEQYAHEKNVSYIVLCDSIYPHWPVNQLIQGGTAPDNWLRVKEETFERTHPVWGHQTEKYQIYKRIPPGANGATD